MFEWLKFWKKSPKRQSSSIIDKTAKTWDQVDAWLKGQEGSRASNIEWPRNEFVMYIRPTGKFLRFDGTKYIDWKPGIADRIGNKWDIL
jgi:hypothetical protein